MDPDARTAVLGVGIAFCVLFGGLTLAVVAESGLDVLTLTSFLILALLVIGLIGAIRHPPDE